MEGKSVKTKETDITGVLVGILVMLLAVLFATSVSKLNSTQKTTSAKAAPKKAPLKGGPVAGICGGKVDSVQFCKDQFTAYLQANGTWTTYSDLSAVTWIKGSDCNTGNSQKLNYKICQGAKDLTLDQYSCCVPKSVIYAANDSFCQNYVNTVTYKYPTIQLDTICKPKGCQTAYGNKETNASKIVYKWELANTKCDFVDSTMKVKDNVCCLKDYPPPTPTP